MFVEIYKKFVFLQFLFLYNYNIKGEMQFLKKILIK